MTFKTDDKGQRYEVRAKDEAGKQVIIGWADDPKNLVESVKLHPSLSDPDVIDRQEAKERE